MFFGFDQILLPLYKINLSRSTCLVGKREILNFLKKLFKILLFFYYGTYFLIISIKTL